MFLSATSFLTLEFGSSPGVTVSQICHAWKLKVYKENHRMNLYARCDLGDLEFELTF